MDARSPATRPRTQIAADEARGTAGVADDVAHVLGKQPQCATLCDVWTLSSRGSASRTTSAEQRKPPMTNRVLSDVANTLRSDSAPEILTAQVNWSCPVSANLSASHRDGHGSAYETVVNEHRAVSSGAVPGYVSRQRRPVGWDQQG
ncbi:hypothetical protein Pa4123_89230 [Phytohabitans aurantiacus]|uniref:Uncharacterized protein n=1 Tax=Phytohabitans aurantiacus TaxID=3016789 RepID=A0ABQ5RAF4_9ACTN|nr:hypothetical protein Pa4123_89230 [Phytohabitans aurantiacus]